MSPKNTLNYTPLNQNVSWARAFTFSQQTILRNITGVISVIFGGFMVFSVFIFGVIMLIVGLTTKNATDVYISIGLFAGCVLLVLGILYGIKSATTKQIRMNEFAAANGITLISNMANPDYSGLIFDEGDTRSIEEAYVFPNLQNTEFGNYTYVTGSGKNRTVHTYGYIKIQLPRQLPHMLLDATSNNIFGKFSNLPAMFSSDQKLQLEGDFNNYFTLYAPKEYETDALYIFTPDVMQALITSSKEYDVEIVDGTLFIYSSDYFDMTKQLEIEELLHVIGSLSKDIFEQSDYYADERIGDRTKNVVAYEGRRLKTSHWPITIGSLFFLSYFTYMILRDGILNIVEIIFIVIAIIVLLILYKPLFKKKK